MEAILSSLGAHMFLLTASCQEEVEELLSFTDKLDADLMQPERVAAPGDPSPGADSPAPTKRPTSVLLTSPRRRPRPLPSQAPRGVTWTDSAGGLLADIRWIPQRESHEASSDAKRLIVLLLSPKHHKYELICCEYPLLHTETQTCDDESTDIDISANVVHDGRITVRDILRQLPAMASHELLKRQRYIALCRRQDNTELINALPVQQYGLGNFEMLWAVPRFYHSKELAPLVACVLSRKGLLRAIRFSSLHWQVHRLSAPAPTPTPASIPAAVSGGPKREAAASGVKDKAPIPGRSLAEDVDATPTSADDEEDHQLATRQFPLCQQPAVMPSAHRLRVLPPFLSILRPPPLVDRRAPTWGSFLTKSRERFSLKRGRFAVVLFAGAGWSAGAPRPRSIASAPAPPAPPAAGRQHRPKPKHVVRVATASSPTHSHTNGSSVVLLSEGRIAV